MIRLVRDNLPAARYRSDNGGMDCTHLALDAFGRVHELLPVVLDGLSAADVRWQPDPAANSIGWLAWHLARVEDDHMAGLVGAGQAWTEEGWAERFALPYPVRAVGYGQGPDDVAAFAGVDPHLLVGYYAAVHARTVAILTGLGADDWERVVDERFDPPVTAAVRVVSVINDVTQHIGQVGYVRGLLERASSRESGWKGHV